MKKSKLSAEIKAVGATLPYCSVAVSEPRPESWDVDGGTTSVAEGEIVLSARMASTSA